MGRGDPLRVFDEYPNYDRLCNESWTCILLFDGKYADTGRLRVLLVVDWDGDVAHRIGAIALKHSSTLPWKDLPGRQRRRIRLG